MNNSNNVPDGTDKPKDIEHLSLSDPKFDALFNTPQLADTSEQPGVGETAVGTAFAPLPIGPYRESAKPGQRNQIFGSCSPFCTNGGHGMPVDEHGPWCESMSRGLVAGYDPDGIGLNAVASIKDRYMHGEYLSTVNLGRLGLGGRYISLEIYRGEERHTEIYLPIGEAFRVAAALQQLAGEADQLNVPLAVA